jgi:hypothetical protein
MYYLGCVQLHDHWQLFITTHAVTRQSPHHHQSLSETSQGGFDAG